MISKFITAVQTRAIARTNRYLVTLNAPKSDKDGRDLATLFCDATALPGLDFASSQSRIYSENREMPYERLYVPITMSFYVDADMVIKTMFDKWQASVVDPETRVMAYYDDYIRDITIQVLQVSESASPPYQVVLHEAWPKSVGAVTMDYTSHEIMKLQVTFLYKWWDNGEPAAQLITT